MRTSQTSADKSFCIYNRLFLSGGKKERVQRYSICACDSVSVRVTDS